jgi:hypothetical protein
LDAPGGAAPARHHLGRPAGGNPDRGRGEPDRHRAAHCRFPAHGHHILLRERTLCSHRLVIPLHSPRIVPCCTDKITPPAMGGGLLVGALASQYRPAGWRGMRAPRAGGRRMSS